MNDFDTPEPSFEAGKNYLAERMKKEPDFLTRAIQEKKRKEKDGASKKAHDEEQELKHGVVDESSDDKDGKKIRGKEKAEDHEHPNNEVIISIDSTLFRDRKVRNLIGDYAHTIKTTKDGNAVALIATGHWQQVRKPVTGALEKEDSLTVGLGGGYITPNLLVAGFAGVSGVYSRHETLKHGNDPHAEKHGLTTKSEEELKKLRFGGEVGGIVHVKTPKTFNLLKGTLKNTEIVATLEGPTDPYMAFSVEKNLLKNFGAGVSYASKTGFSINGTYSFEKVGGKLFLGFTPNTPGINVAWRMEISKK